MGTNLAFVPAYPYSMSGVRKQREAYSALYAAAVDLHAAHLGVANAIRCACIKSVDANTDDGPHNRPGIRTNKRGLNCQCGSRNCTSWHRPSATRITTCWMRYRTS